MLKHALLALLVQQPRHGYELKVAFEKTMGSLWPEINIGQVYTTLSRLERDALVTSHVVDSTGERTDKRVYELTPAGLAALKDWLAQPSESIQIKNEFFVKLALTQVMDLEEAKDLIARQRREYLQAMRILDDLSANPASDANLVSSLLLEGALLYLRAGLEWLDLCDQRIAQQEVK